MAEDPRRVPSAATSPISGQIQRHGPKGGTGPGSAFVCDYTPLSVPQFPRLLSFVPAKVSERILPSDYQASSTSSDGIANAVGERHLLAPRPPAERHQEPTFKGRDTFCLGKATATSFLGAEEDSLQTSQAASPAPSPTPKPPGKPRAQWHAAPVPCLSPGQPPSCWAEGWKGGTMIPIVTKFPPEDLIQDVRVSDHKRN